ncbi:MAG: hypothetical protein ACREV6_11745 [Clostridium sp.]|uniref:hypothetical protein n=1 Tax=Clostridium sp. TaxID=1506 RepID=UPI003D6CC16C
MLYRTILDNENMDIQDPQYIHNVNQSNPKEQPQMGPQYMPSMDYQMMDEMYNSPPTYGSQMSQQQYQPTEDALHYMERKSYDNDSYQHGYKHGHQQGYHQGYYQGYNHHKNNYPFNDLYPFLFLPFFLGRE